ncbi:MAG: hypothetical protein ACOYM3_25820 [Terrimicrobiaceae bacterium]
MSLPDLKLAIQKRLEVVADHELRDRDQAAHLEALKAAHRALESQRAGLPSNTDPQLLHFLDRQSYEKALAFLQNSGS